MAETALKLGAGFREGVAGDWIVEAVTHTLNSEGYDTLIEGVAKVDQ